MKIGFLASDKPREHLLADAFLLGAKKHGHEAEVFPLQPEPFVGPYDVACMVGVKSRELWRAHKAAGIPTIYLDKGYCRQKRKDGVAGWEYWRVSINAHHPTARLSEERLPSDRLDELGLELKPWRKAGRQIVIAGSSMKYHEFYGLSNPTTYASGIVKGLREVTNRPIVYRPKPSWREAVPIRKARFSRPPESIGSVLQGAHALVTHGSNACFEAILAGVPCVILGDAVARPLSTTALENIEAPFLAKQRQRVQWLANLAYWQWTLKEMASGAAWDFIGPAIHG